MTRWRRGFPAHAGMDPTGRRRHCDGSRLPRTRGDGPFQRRWARSLARASPHTRGWTLSIHDTVTDQDGFPAHAGMDLISTRTGTPTLRLPRTRGDGPRDLPSGCRSHRASPHTRGWTLKGSPRPSPRGGFPAHAGMDPYRDRLRRRDPWLPRTRGDGPRASTSRVSSASASPHTRGWTRLALPAQSRTVGFPAHAGMDPQLAQSPPASQWLPRTRGDGPVLAALAGMRPGASPHTRGWTPARLSTAGNGHGFPAHAGMDPDDGGRHRDPAGLPRTRGDGPCASGWRRLNGRASPHTRGWTRQHAGAGVDIDGFPAHAGMDPKVDALEAQR